MVLLASGCTGTSGEEPQGSVMVERFTATPSQLYASDSSFVRLQIQAVNTGTSDAELAVGQDGNEVLRDSCPDFFKVSSFDARTSTTPETRESYDLEPGSSVDMDWRLDLRDGIRIPLQGYECGFNALLQFNYSTSTFEQVQVKPSEDVENVPLDSGSSPGPMNLVIEPVPGTLGAEQTGRYVSGPDDTVTVLFRLQGMPSDGESGAVEVDESSFEASVTQPLSTDSSAQNIGPSDCSNYPDSSRDLVLRQGESVDVRCELDIGSADASRVPQISASVDYTYLKNPGERTVRVDGAATQ
jgi:hypothetical protein